MFRDKKLDEKLQEAQAALQEIDEIVESMAADEPKDKVTKPFTTAQLLKMGHYHPSKLRYDRKSPPKLAPVKEETEKKPVKKTDDAMPAAPAIRLASARRVNRAAHAKPFVATLSSVSETNADNEESKTQRNAVKK